MVLHQQKAQQNGRTNPAYKKFPKNLSLYFFLTFNSDSRFDFHFGHFLVTDVPFQPENDVQKFEF